MTARFLSGLPGTGPEPVHFYIARPTPWTEGATVQFSELVRPDWIANLQTGWGYAKQILEWTEAAAVIIIADGAVYFARPESPDEWRCHDSLGIECVLAADNRNAIIATYTDLIMLDVNGNVVWRRTLASDGVEIASVTQSAIDGRLCYDPPDGWAPFRVNRIDGIDA